ncbi:DHH family phosphoesterase [Defluviitalea phaphyphila]|uniref:DHH family phosphoesterase n=1 Tax=Defluviitalea phaphyphila TaxID=1473580 RepID=UPI000730395F|nr:bifunctional oligoribonuclease/PAP phosphatase NrnA [Defluviitalea phaphyphila]
MINSNIIEQIKKYNNIVLAAHVNPDGDAIGACTALALALSKIGKNPVILMDEYPEKYNFLHGREYIHKEYINDEPLELFITLDCGDLERLGDYISYFRKAPITINIDHHITNTKYGHYNEVKKEASSTCEIIYEVIKSCEIPFDDKIASSLYTGIAFDTGGFKHSSTTSFTHEVISDLLKYKVNFTYIMNKLFYSRSLTSSRLLGLALSKIELLENDKLCFCDLSKKEMESLGATIDDVDGIIASMQNIEGVLVSVLIYEKDKNEIKVSFRSVGDKDVSKIAKMFNGGGHKNASGCTINKNLEAVKKEILKKIQEELF